MDIISEFMVRRVSDISGREANATKNVPHNAIHDPMKERQGKSRMIQAPLTARSDFLNAFKSFVENR